MPGTLMRVALALVLLVPVVASEAGGAEPKTECVRPEGDYRVCRFVLASALPGDEAGHRLAMPVLAAFRGGRAVYCYGRATADWPRYRHNADSWVALDASNLHFEAGKLKGTVTSDRYWGLWPAAFEVSGTVAEGGEFRGTHASRFAPVGRKGTVGGRLEATADPARPMAVAFTLPSLYTGHGHIRSPQLAFRLEGGNVGDGRFTSGRGGKWGFTGRIDGGSLRVEGERLTGTVAATVTGGDAHPGTYEFRLDGRLVANLVAGTCRVVVDGTEWAERAFEGTARGLGSEPAPADAVYAMVLAPSPTGGDSLVLHVTCRDGRAVRALARGAFGTDYAADPAGLTVEGGRLKGTCELSFTGGIGWPQPVDATYALDVTAEAGTVAGTFEAAFDAGKRFEGAITGRVRDQDAMADAFALPDGRPHWPDYTGPGSDVAPLPPEVPLVKTLAEARLVWASEAPITQGREAGDASDAANLGKLRFVYGGYSSPVVAGGRVYQFFMQPAGGPHDAGLAETTLAAAETGEERAFATWRWSIRADDVVVCLDAADGRLLWQRTFPGESINWTAGNKHATINMTPCVHRGRLYVLGGKARVHCVDAATGERLWDVPLEPHASRLDAALKAALQERRLVREGGAFENFLLGAGDVVVTVVEGGGLVALDAKTGKERWRRPARAVGRWAREGGSLLIASTGRDTLALDPATGEVRWTLDGVRDVPGNGTCALHGDRLLVAASPADGRSYGKGEPLELRLYRMRPDGAERLWTHTGVRSLVRRPPVAWYGGGLFASDHARKRIVRVDLASGRTTAEIEGKFEWRWPADGRLFTIPDMGHETAGNLTVVYRAADLSKIETWAPPHKATTGYDVSLVYPVVDGRVFYRGSDRLYCYDLRARDAEGR